MEQTQEHLTPEEYEQIVADKLEIFGQNLATKRTEWVQARKASGVETRWKEDYDQFLGEDEISKRVTQMMDAVQQGFPVMGKENTTPTRSSIVVNITRPRTNAAEARLADMLFPTDDSNWGIQPTPVPSLTEALKSSEQVPGPDGQPQIIPDTDGDGNQKIGQLQTPDGQVAQVPLQRAMTKADVAKQTIEKAKKACDGMQNKIADALEECHYNSEGRAMLHDAAVIGTGILKGPITTKNFRKAWTQVGDAFVMEFVEELTPTTVRVDPWRVFPDPACGESIHHGSGIFEYQPLTARQVRDLAKQPGYLPAAVSKVLEEGPRNLMIESDHERAKESKAGIMTSDKAHFEHWIYTGEIDPELLRSAGVKVPDGSLKSISGVVEMINSTVVKAYLNPLESGELPYDFFVWEKGDGSVPWGWGGIPRLNKAPQRAVTAGWRQAMDNAGLAVGPQVIVNPNAIQPADKQWQISGRKIWWLMDTAVQDVNSVFKTVEFNMHLPEIQGLIKMAMELADEETGVPKLAQGEQGNVPETAQGMTILMNSANVVLRRLVKQFDDTVTKPHISRYYEWFMLYDDDASIKGDFTVDARGSSALLVKDMQQQALIQMGQFMGNPTLAPLVNWDEWFGEVLKSNHIDGSKILRAPEEVEKARQATAQSQPQDPRIVAAQMRAQADVQIAEARSKEQVAEVETRRAETEQQLQLGIQKLQLEREIAMLKLSTEQQISLEEIKAKLADSSMRLKAQVALSQLDKAHAQHERVMDQLAQPAVEPAGRAEPGKAFQQ